MTGQTQAAHRRQEAAARDARRCCLRTIAMTIGCYAPLAALVIALT